MRSLYVPGSGLVAVDHEVARPHARRAEAPLDPGREAGAAAAEQARGLHLGHDLFGLLRHREAEAVVAAGGEVALERVAVVVAEARRDDRLGVADGHGCASARRRGPSCGDPLRLGATGRRRDTRGAVSGDRLADPGERAVRRDLLVAPACAQVVHEGIEVLVRHPVEVAVVHLQARRLGARRDALVALEGERPVRRRAAVLHAQLSSAWWSSSSPPLRKQEIDVQTLTTYLPTGSRLNIS